MISRFVILFVCIVNSGFAAFANGEGYVTVPMPGFFNSNILRYKQALDAENGKVWIGTRDLGILVWSNSAWTFWDPTTGCPDFSVTAIDLLPSGEAWVGCDTGGIGYFDGFAWNTYANWNSAVPATHVNCIKKSGNDVWAGTTNGLLRFDGQSWTQFTVANSSIPSDTIWAIEADGNGGILVATQQGYIRYNNSTWSEYWGNTGSDAVTALHVSAGGTRYLISAGELFVFGNSQWVNTNQNGSMSFPGHPFLGGRSIASTPQGSVIVNCAESAIYKLQNDEVQIYYLPVLFAVSNYAYNLLDCDELTGEIWAINTTCNNTLQNDLFLMDFPSYNGLGKGLTPANLKFLNINNTEAAISNRGDMHYDYINASYRCPKTQPASTTFISNFWVSGLDSANNIHGAFQRYRVLQRNDFFPGPLDPATGVVDSATAWEFDRIWSVTQYSISEFQWQFAQGNVQNGSWSVPSDISEWPAQGNTSVNGPLAPFVDVNQNGIYDPLIGGDYPLISGDQEMFWVFNDKLATHTETSSMPLGFQINATARAWNCPQADDSTEIINAITLYEFNVINRSGSAYANVVLSWVQDVDLGNWNDDYIGCDTSNNSGFVYNGDAIDEATSVPSFGNYPPMSASIVLEGPLAPAGDQKDNDHDGTTDEPGEEILLSGFHTYQTSSFGPNGNASTPLDYYRYQRGMWKDSVPVTVGGNGYGGTIPINFMYPGNPFDTAQWNEASAGQISGDRFLILNCGPATVNPGDTIHFTIAMVTLNDSSLSWGTQAYFNQLQQACAKIRNWNANNSWPGCTDLFDNTGEIDNPELRFSMYPNPATESITLQLPELENSATLTITDISGRIVKLQTLENEITLELSIADLASGVYFVTLHNGDLFSTQKLIRN